MGIGGKVVDDSGSALPGAQLRLRQGEGGEELTAFSDTGGNFRFPVSKRGTYTLAAELPGFETASTEIVCCETSGRLVIVLPPRKVLAENVQVTADSVPPDEAEVSGTYEGDTLHLVPMAGERFQDVLPLTPSVVRGPDGNISISGARASENSLLVNGANVTDPVTGEFAIDLPLEAVETVDVYTNPYSAEYGKFTGGITSVSTRSGGDRFRVEFNDFIPRPHFTDGLNTRGLETWKPRIRFSGPTGLGSLYYSQAFQYKFLRTFLDDIPGDESRNYMEVTAFDSITQLNYAPGMRNQWTATLSFFPQDIQNVNLNTFLPLPSTPDYEQRGYNLAAGNRYLMENGLLLESLVSWKSFDVAILPKSNAENPFVIGTEGMRGAYFHAQNRDSSRFQWSETMSFAPLNYVGSHQLELGLDVSRSGYDGNAEYSQVNVLRSDGTIAEIDTFSKSASLGQSSTEVSVHAQDRWQPSAEWTFEPGLRLDRVQKTGEWNWGPRFTLAYAPREFPGTAIRAGIGIFHDKILLNAYDFERYPARIITKVDPGGKVEDTFVLQPRIAGEIRSPSSLTWNIELDRQITKSILLRANYLERDGRRQLLVLPRTDSLLLSSTGESTYQSWELTSRWDIDPESRVFLSYVHSSSRGDSNDFAGYFGNFPRPLLRENEDSYLPQDVTHRFLAWGIVRVPWRVSISPVLEVRSGFRYSAVDELQNFIGIRNSLRFPVFSQLDLRVTRTFRAMNKYNVVIGFKVFNVLNRFNPRDVQNNIDSPAFGTFYNSVHRTFRAALEIQY